MGQLSTLEGQPLQTPVQLWGVGWGGEAPEPVFGPSCAAGSNRVETETMGHTGLAAQVLEPRRQVLVMGKHLFPKSLGYENSSFYK